MSNASSSPGHFPVRGQQVPWDPTSAIGISALAFFGAQIVAALVLSVIVGTFGSQVSTENWFNSMAGQFYFVLISDALIMAIIWFFLHKRRAGWQPLGFSRSPVWKDLGYALGGYAVYFGLLILVFSLAGSFTQINLDQKQELGFDNLLGSGEKLMALISLVLLPPLVEETVFRGFLFTGLRKKLVFVQATLIASLLFASLHLLESSKGLLWVAGIDTFVLSIVLCYLREKTGALWASIGLHAIKNAIAFWVLIRAVNVA
jgi:membrane protease YdiL (CAAX protease family)